MLGASSIFINSSSKSSLSDTTVSICMGALLGLEDDRGTRPDDKDMSNKSLNVFTVPMSLYGWEEIHKKKEMDRTRKIKLICLAILFSLIEGSLRGQDMVAISQGPPCNWSGAGNIKFYVDHKSLDNIKNNYNRLSPICQMPRRYWLHQLPIHVLCICLLRAFNEGVPL